MTFYKSLPYNDGMNVQESPHGAIIDKARTCIQVYRDSLDNAGRMLTHCEESGQFDVMTDIGAMIALFQGKIIEAKVGCYKSLLALGYTVTRPDDAAGCYTSTVYVDL